jgi:DNA-3-methyladenine glycosylase II
LEYELLPRPPFRLDLTAWAQRRRPTNELDGWDGRRFGRVLVVDGQAHEVTVAQEGAAAAPRLRVSAGGVPEAAVGEVTRLLERLLGLSIDLGGFYAMAAADERLAPLVARYAGVKPPRFASVFESLVAAIASQQITLTFAIALLNRLAQAFGRVAASGRHAFPLPEDLADATPEQLRALAFSRQKAETVVAVVRAVLSGALDLEGLARLDDEAAAARLRSLRGVGRWTAEYVLLRGLGRLNVFPHGDVGARANLTRWLSLDHPLTEAEEDGVLRPWQPYAGLVYLHLLLGRLEEAGLVVP